MVSVIIPSYNHGKALRYCLDSLRVQTHQSFEVIIVDDGSSDHTDDIVHQYVRSYNEGVRMRYVRISHKGAPVARNVGARQARGDYLLFADADVVFKPHALARLLNALAENLKAAYAYSDFRFGWKKFYGRPFDANALKTNNFIHTTSLIRRARFSGFDETLARFQDWDLWLTMLEHGDTGIYVPEELFVVSITRPGISTWRPRFWYFLCSLFDHTIGIAPIAYHHYIAARTIVARKHGLT